MTRWRRRSRCSRASICVSRRRSFFDRLPLLLRHPAVLRRLQHRRLLRFQADHHQMALHLAAGRAEHPARRDGADGRRFSCWTMPSFSSRRTCTAPVLLRQDHHRPLLVSGGVLPGRLAFRLSLFPLYAHAPPCPGAEEPSPTLLIGRAADAEVLLRGIESGAVKRLWPVGMLSPSPADRGQSIRNIPVLGGVDDIEDVIRDFARREQADQARGHDAIGVRAGGASRSGSDAREAGSA